MMQGRYLAATLALSCAAGCAHVAPEPGCTRLGDVAFCLQPVTVSFVATQSLQTLPLRSGRGAPGVLEQGHDESGKAIVQLEARGGELVMVGITPFGRRIWQIRYDATHGVSSDLPRETKPSAEQVIAGLQLAAWPLQQARAGIGTGGAQLLESPDGRQRELRDGTRVVFSADCEGERPLCRRAELRYETLGWKLRIETLESDG